MRRAAREGEASPKCARENQKSHSRACFAERVLETKQVIHGVIADAWL